MTTSELDWDWTGNMCESIDYPFEEDYAMNDFGYFGYVDYVEPIIELDPYLKKSGGFCLDPPAATKLFRTDKRRKGFTLGECIEGLNLDYNRNLFENIKDGWAYHLRSTRRLMDKGETHEKVWEHIKKKREMLGLITEWLNFQIFDRFAPDGPLCPGTLESDDHKKCKNMIETEIKQLKAEERKLLIAWQLKN